MTAVFSITRDQVIKAAMQQCGAIAASENPSATDFLDCTIYLQAMLKYWNAEKGFAAWCYENINWPCVAGQLSYTIGESAANVTNERPLKIAQAWTIDTTTGDNQPLAPQTREQFFRLSPRNSPGPASSYYYDPQLGSGVFHVWSVPTDNSRDFYANIVRPISDVTGGTGVFDIPQEGYLALVWGLAEQIMSMYGTEEMTQRRIEQKAPKYLSTFMDFNEEDGSMFFQPSAQLYSR